MKGLRTIRIVLAIIFFVASLVCLLTAPDMPVFARAARRVQILPSASAIAMGVMAFWFAVTLLVGRVYCSTVCPLGTFQDIVIRIKRSLRPRTSHFGYQPARTIRYQVLAIYIVCLIAGVVAVPYWLEPWNVMRNIVSTVNPSAVQSTWLSMGVGVTTGIVSGIVSAVMIVICSIWTGRGYCTELCPVGAALGCVGNWTLLHIEIDPDKCISCMRCEEVCKSQCIKVTDRYVDNSRCVRCFDCLNVCPNDAIRLQKNRNRRATPLMTATGK